MIAMAKRGRDDALHDGSRATKARKVWRLGAWTGIAVLSVAAALMAAYTETGTHRLASGDASAAPSLAAEQETQRLADAVRALTADRDRLALRVSALERNLDDVTGSIQSRPGAERSGGPNPGASPLPPSLAPVAPTESARAPSAPARAATQPIALPPANPAPVAAAPARAPALPTATADSAAAASTATRTEFGIDLGTAATVEGLRNLWIAIKGTQAPLLEGLRPVAAVRDGAKPGALELRLVAGPLANAGVAARLCAALADAGLTCAPAVFDGQRLALN
jgi:hypothetical protein